ncbi:hypothetical protein [Mucilaginibacter sp. FT3.2]|uniref:hypothetical protein n=1 Tax=Mucilaginibacter sp. FT3.2 TaxID=2723090 RepID=UPI00161C263C|nr:hypothetical protein [Mucilaginibacter sp. FT3.2]MBB6231155.1 hypothetical protein [Mucilaginibacter sp. FT3.2]
MNINSNQGVDPEENPSDASAEDLAPEIPNNIEDDVAANAVAPDFHSVEALRDKNTPIG